MRPATANPTARAVLRPWPLVPSIRHLVLVDVDMVPTGDDIARWVADAFESSPSDDGTAAGTLRTGALFPAAADAFRSAGFREVDRLALLQRPLIDSTPPRVRRTGRTSGVRTARLSARDLDAAADIDAASFPHGWRQDAASLDSIAEATPQARRRKVHLGDSAPRRPVGFAITGRAGPNGYLQRLAVHPDARRHGAARALVDDALAWLVRRGAHRALVNTGVDNLGAIELYRRAGFERRDDELVVLELDRRR